MMICIAGMHRSGTSMVTRLLNLCGLYIGEPDDLLPAASDNTEGYWENIHFTALNNALLDYFGGTWDMPPPHIEAWTQQPNLAGLHQEASALIERLQIHSAWGWKDPRNSLTLPFWRSLVPDLKTVICLRHPQEVAMSLHLRNQSSTLLGLTLWQIYNQSVMSFTQPANRVITHYNAYFENPAGELRRVLSVLGWQLDDEIIEQACKAVMPANRHHHMNAAWPQTALPSTINSLYKQMCSEADIAEQTLAGNQGVAVETGAEAAHSTQRVSYVLALEKSLEQANLRIAALEDQNTTLENQAVALKQEVAQLRSAIEQMQLHLKHLEHLEAVASNEVNALHNAKFYKWTTSFWELRRRLIGK
jgi:hypothetical protein